MAENLIHVKVINRDQMLFENDVKAVSSINDKGSFDVLPHHANFITLIKNVLVIHKVDGTNVEMKIQSGLLIVHENNLQVFLGIINMAALPTSAPNQPREQQNPHFPSLPKNST